MLSTMPKKKRTEVANGADSLDPFSVRPDTPDLLKAIDKLAKDTRRTRNATVIILLEEALKAQERWPHRR